ncbi:MAG: hypothetical protein K9N23_06600 [Akkermansiaceae bacterium]|nr:hypothetical protein [Akkermansiaceae bacterium]MCF7731336.1 hypothetical protein [Akkermansiaceae bacterium]
MEIPQPGGGFLRVEVLHTVLGLKARDLRRTVDVEVAGVVGRIPLPHLVLKAKLANAPGLDDSGRFSLCRSIRWARSQPSDDGDPTTHDSDSLDGPQTCSRDPEVVEIPAGSPPELPESQTRHQGL